MLKQIIKILVIGAGNIGSRHLQGLMNISHRAFIEVVEPSEENRKIARERAITSRKSENKVEITFHKSINEIQIQEAHLAIIATNSDVRPLIIMELIKRVKLKYLILEKVVFQSDELFTQLSAELKSYGIKTWVNCPRRLYWFYQGVKNIVADDEIIKMRVSGGNWGLGCNAVHFIDLFAFLTSDNNIKVEYSSLDKKLIESKRKGFLEFTGSIGYSSARGYLELESFAYNNHRPVIDICTSSVRWLISESSGSVMKLSSDHNVCNILKEKFPLQSELTGAIVDEIVETGECGLTALDESAIYHSLLFKPLLNHIGKIKGNIPEFCPVT